MVYLDQAVVTISRPAFKGEFCDVLLVHFTLRDVPENFKNLDYDKEYLQLEEKGAKTEL